MNKIPITKPYIGTEESEAVKAVLESGWLVQGAKVSELEERIAEHEQVRYCCATTSCTTALQLSMFALGMGAGMDVLVPSFTFVATANAVVSTGAVPVLMDVDCKTYNLDMTYVQNYVDGHYEEKDGLMNKENGNRLWGIVVVHQFGLCADMAAVNSFAGRYRLKVLEDAACALGSKIGDKFIGGFGNTACVSFHPRKSITTGEGGMILTNDEQVYTRVVGLRNHGSMTGSAQRHQSDGFLLPQYADSGYNYRMTDIQGAIGCEQIKKLDYILHRRAEIAEFYDELLEKASSVARPPFVPEGCRHTYQSYVCMLDLGDDVTRGREIRDKVMEDLGHRGIATRQGTHAVHKLEYYRNRFGFSDTDLPMADRCDSLTISLPVFVTISKEEQRSVIDNLVETLKQRRQINWKN